MAIGDVWRLLWIYTDAGTGKRLTHRLHVELTTVVPFNSATTFAEMEDYWDAAGATGAALKSHSSNAINLVQLEAQKVFPLPLGVPIVSAITPIPGTDAGENESGQTCPVASLRTNVGGRRARGRMYLPPCSEVDIGGSGFAAGIAQDIANRTADLINTLPGVGADQIPVVFSEVGSSTEPIQLVKVDQRVRTQRRRQERRPNYVQAIV